MVTIQQQSKSSVYSSPFTRSLDYSTITWRTLCKPSGGFEPIIFLRVVHVASARSTTTARTAATTRSIPSMASAHAIKWPFGLFGYKMYPIHHVLTLSCAVVLSVSIIKQFILLTLSQHSPSGIVLKPTKGISEGCLRFPPFFTGRNIRSRPLEDQDCNEQLFWGNKLRVQLSFMDTVFLLHLYPCPFREFQFYGEILFVLSYFVGCHS